MLIRNIWNFRWNVSIQQQYTCTTLLTAHVANYTPRFLQLILYGGEFNFQKTSSSYSLRSSWLYSSYIHSSLEPLLYGKHEIAGTRSFIAILTMSMPLPALSNTHTIFIRATFGKSNWSWTNMFFSTMLLCASLEPKRNLIVYFVEQNCYVCLFCLYGIQTTIEPLSTNDHLNKVTHVDGHTWSYRCTRCKNGTFRKL